MIQMVDSIGSALWRASWQGVVLAILVGLLIACLGNRLTPKWRYLLWGVVVARLLLVMAPQSSWSLFNLAPAERGEVAVALVELCEIDSMAKSMPSCKAVSETRGNILVPDSSPVSGSEAMSSPVESAASLETETAANKTTEPRDDAQSAGWFLHRWAVGIWLAGCMVFAVRLAGASLALRRRLLACRLVADTSLQEMLDSICRALGVRRRPVLLVTPETVSPFVAGVFRPRIVVPESLLTGSSRGRLRQVFAHELAHVQRGDLAANWFLLAARVLHWFNPAACWAVRSMQAEREAACDQIALATLAGTERGHYAETIMELASSLAQPPMAPGVIGLFSSRSTLKSRVKRILCPPTSPPIPSSVVAGLLLALGLVGLTDAMPGKAADEAARSSAAVESETPALSKDAQGATRDFSLRGVCRDADDETVLAGIRVRLIAARGLVGAAECVAETTTSDEGRFEFVGLEAPRPNNALNRLDYGLLATDATRPAVFLGGYTLHQFDGRELAVPIGRERTTLSGRVLDEQGRPVAGARVGRYVLQRRPVTGAGSAVTDNSGVFLIADLDAKGNRISFHSDREGKMQIGTVPSNDERLRKLNHVQFHVFHPDYPIFRTAGLAMRRKLNFVLPIGCTLSGTVTDSVTGRPASGVIVTAQNMDAGEHAHALTDNRGRYRLPVARGNYNILARTEDRVCVAIPDRECPVGEVIELPPLTLIRGGRIAGQVINTSTGKPEVWTESGERVAVGFYGPSLPGRKIFGTIRLALVDDEGRFVLRAAPGKNYPYLVNTRGSRMSWDTRKQDPVVVVEGETVDTKILVTPPLSAGEKMAAASKILSSLPKTTPERVEGILHEFRNLNHTVDETEIWCLLMKDRTKESASTRESASTTRRSFDEALPLPCSMALRAVSACGSAKWRASRAASYGSYQRLLPIHEAEIGHQLPLREID